MEKAKAVEILIKAFKDLPKKNQQNLYWHAQHKTPICCGRYAQRWYRKNKAG